MVEPFSNDRYQCREIQTKLKLLKNHSKTTGNEKAGQTHMVMQKSTRETIDTTTLEKSQNLSTETWGE